MPNEILDLPLAIQVILGSGYAAYLLAFSGLRGHHTPTDVIFRTLALGLAPAAVLASFPMEQHGVIVPGAIAFSCAIFLGAAWRLVGSRLVRQLLRLMNISWSDDLPNA